MTSVPSPAPRAGGVEQPSDQQPNAALGYAEACREAAPEMLAGTCHEDCRCVGETGHSWCVERRRYAAALTALADLLERIERSQAAWLAFDSYSAGAMKAQAALLAEDSSILNEIARGYVPTPEEEPQG